MNYADVNGDGEVTPGEIIEENNYYPFGLKHQGYNELAGDVHKYKFLNREYQPELGYNTIATDYRHYDAALGRFNNMDALSELAPSQTPYRYGFNNPVYWTDPTGLFEDPAAAKAYAIEKGYKSYDIVLHQTKGYVLVVTEGKFDGFQFYYGEELQEELEDYTFTPGGAGGQLGSFAPSAFLGFTYAEMGQGATLSSIVAAGVEGRALDNIKQIAKNQDVSEWAKANKPSMEKLAGRAKIAGRVIGGFGIGITYYQWDKGQISGTEATVDAVMGVIGFIPGWGTAISLTYFAGKTLYEQFSGNTLFEKPNQL